MSKEPTDPEHRSNRVHWFAGRVHRVLDEVAGCSVASLGSAELAEIVLELAREERRIAGIRLAALAAADRVGVAEDGTALHTAGWLTNQLRIDRSPARREVDLARALDGEFTATST